ncbi:hypothetical protein AB0O82_36410 [Kitasatospora sp. NPDC088264]|uniref:hypothetical protein n=1 Tax=unclassified Kitasatospora TaxID=2633591 RepID=UPI003446E850
MTTQRYGDLELRFTPDIRRVWPNVMPGVRHDSAIYAANEPMRDGWGRAAHHFGPPLTAGGLPRDGAALLLRDLSADRSMLRPPVRYDRIGDLPQDVSVGIWRPVPPDGYIALGDIVATNAPHPDFGSFPVVCVKREHNGRLYVRRGEFGDRLLESGNMRLWSVVAPQQSNQDTEERLLVPPGGFTAVFTADRPSSTPTGWVLDLPAVVERRPGPGVPRLTSFDRPPAQTTVTDRTVTVPYFMVEDPVRDAHWQIRNSPFYRIRRLRRFDVALFRDNRNGTVQQEQSEAVTTGVSREDSTAFNVTTGISVGVAVGIEVSAKPFGMGVSGTTTYSVSATVELGYERRRSVTVMNEVTRTYGLAVPPRSSGCLWMEHHQLVPVRADGTELGPRASLGFRTDHYVTGEFPGGAGVRAFTEEDGGERTPLPDSIPPTVITTATEDDPS